MSEGTLIENGVGGRTLEKDVAFAEMEGEFWEEGEDSMLENLNRVKNEVGEKIWWEKGRKK